MGLLGLVVSFTFFRFMSLIHQCRTTKRLAETRKKYSSTTKRSRFITNWGYLLFLTFIRLMLLYLTFIGLETTNLKWTFKIPILDLQIFKKCHSEYKKCHS